MKICAYDVMYIVRRLRDFHIAPVSFCGLNANRGYATVGSIQNKEYFEKISSANYMPDLVDVVT